MTLPVRKNAYSFDDFLKAREDYDFYRDDPFIQGVVKNYADEEEWDSLHEKLLKFSPKCPFAGANLQKKFPIQKCGPISNTMMLIIIG
ncbi:MAG: hypothetical protein GX881_08840 [Firmicutes bacterium]|nr:hypothetical protein [Bacillota bacterium]